MHTIVRRKQLTRSIIVLEIYNYYGVHQGQHRDKAQDCVRQQVSDCTVFAGYTCLCNKLQLVKDTDTCSSSPRDSLPSTRLVSDTNDTAMSISQYRWLSVIHEVSEFYAFYILSFFVFIQFFHNMTIFCWLNSASGEPLKKKSYNFPRTVPHTKRIISTCLY